MRNKIDLAVVQKIIQKEFPDQKGKIVSSDLSKRKKISTSKKSLLYLIEVQGNLYVLRINETKKKITNHFFSLSHLIKYNIAPIPICRGEEEGYFYSIESYIQGKHLLHTEKLIPEISQILLCMHQIKDVTSTQDEWRESFFEKIYPHMERFKEICPEFEYLDIIFKFLPKSRNRCLLHGDFKHTNLLVRDKNVFVIDFENAFFGEREFDLGVLYVNDMMSDSLLKQFIHYTGYDVIKVLYYGFAITMLYVVNSEENQMECKNHFVGIMNSIVEKLKRLDLKI